MRNNDPAMPVALTKLETMSVLTAITLCYKNADGCPCADNSDRIALESAVMKLGDSIKLDVARHVFSGGETFAKGGAA